MQVSAIHKTARDWRVRPNLVDYEKARAGFSWTSARRDLDGLPNGTGLNIAHEAVDRHAAGPRRTQVAIRWISRDGTRQDFTFGDLREQTNRFANVLRSCGAGKGDAVAVLAGRIPELYVAALGTLKNGSVFTPLFSAFGPEPIQARMNIARAKILVTTEALYRRKVEALRAALPSLEHVLVVGDPPAIGKLSNVGDLRRLMADADTGFTIPPTGAEDVALLHFTSGTTGKPKGAIHVHDAVVAHHAAPEFDPVSLSPDASLRDEIDLDSMDVLNFALALHRRLGVDIPESDHSRLSTLASAIDYLGSRLSAPASSRRLP